MGRISCRRYIAHLLLSLSAVYFSRLIPQEVYNPPTIYAYAHLCGIIIRAVRRFVPPGLPTSQPYCVTTAYTLLCLHKATTIIGKYTVDHVSTRQHLAIHFTLSFYILSELEFYRQYIAFRGFDNWRTSLAGFFHANVDPEFRVSRGPGSYLTSLPDSWVRYLDGDTKIEGFWNVILSKSHNVCILLWILFWVVGGCFHYIVKRMVNPSLDTESFLDSIFYTDILFKTDRIWKAALAFLLLRVVRQANFIAFWGVVGVVGWVRDGCKTRGEVRRVAYEQLSSV